MSVPGRYGDHRFTGPSGPVPGSASLPGQLSPVPGPARPEAGARSLPSAGQGDTAPTSGNAGALVGQLIDDRYVIEGVLGEGGMGVVYRARHHKIDRRVALKVLKKEWANDKEIVDRFVLEAKACSAIGNPHIIDILDFGTLRDGSTYFAMEFLDGISLTAAIAQRLDPERIARIAIQVCDGLGAAHSRGIVHRDLKPDNIFLLPRNGGDFVKLLDFGIAKVTTDSTQKLTRAGAVFGTPHYMSPEQAAGTAVDHRADIYALGVILYEMASGQLPFDSDNFMGILTQHMYKAPVPIRALVNNAACPPGLEAIVQKCLEKRPGHRYPSTAELAEDLQRFLDKQVPKAVSELMGRSNQYDVPVDYYRASGGAPIVLAGAPKRRTAWLGLAVGALLAAAIGLFAFIKLAPPRPAAPSASAVEALAPSDATTTAPAASSGAPAPIASASAAEAGTPVEIRSAVAGAVLALGSDERPLPATVHVAEGKKLTVVVRAPGHEDTPVTVDGSQPAVSVSPKAVATGGGARPPATATAATSKPTAKPTSTGDGWDGPVKIFNK